MVNIKEKSNDGRKNQTMVEKISEKVRELILFWAAILWVYPTPETSGHMIYWYYIEQIFIASYTYKKPKFVPLGSFS